MSALIDGAAPSFSTKTLGTKRFFLIMGKFQMMSLVERVLTDPDRVNFDAIHQDGENFYRRGVLQHPYDYDFVKVVVRYDDREGAPVDTVISVYTTSHFRRAGERHKWSR